MGWGCWHTQGEGGVEFAGNIIMIMICSQHIQGIRERFDSDVVGHMVVCWVMGWYGESGER